MILPGSGFCTATLTIPVCAAVLVPVAVSWLGDTKVVAKAVPPNITVDPLTKFAPLTVSEKFPTGRRVGLTDCGAGIGFSRFTGLVAESLLSATLVALTVTELGVGRVVLAVAVTRKYATATALAVRG